MVVAGTADGVAATMDMAGGTGNRSVFIVEQKPMNRRVWLLIGLIFVIQTSSFAFNRAHEISVAAKYYIANYFGELEFAAFNQCSQSMFIPTKDCLDRKERAEWWLKYQFELMFEEAKHGMPILHIDRNLNV